VREKKKYAVGQQGKKLLHQLNKKLLEANLIQKSQGLNL
jgi:hypothetical protein